MKSFDLLKKQIIQCKRCPRLRTHCVLIAQKKKREFKDWSYWGNPVPGFGDEHAKLWIVGLAPGAHGANRTGRVFTGDSSGRWLYSALHRIGLSSSPESVSTHDGLTLKQAYISCICRCAPPQNRPTSQEIKNCHAFLSSEWALLNRPPIILALGKIAFEQVIALLTKELHLPKNKHWTFKHGAVYQMGTHTVLVSYHPSRQNTQTKKLTENMWTSVFKKAQELLKNHSLGEL